jgi:hypothetical protein
MSNLFNEKVPWEKAMAVLQKVLDGGAYSYVGGTLCLSDPDDKSVSLCFDVANPKLLSEVRYKVAACYLMAKDDKHAFYEVALQVVGLEDMDKIHEVKFKNLNIFCGAIERQIGVMRVVQALAGTIGMEATFNKYDGSWQLKEKE